MSIAAPRQASAQPLQLVERLAEPNLLANEASRKPAIGDVDETLTPPAKLPRPLGVTEPVDLGEAIKVRELFGTPGSLRANISV